MAIRKTRAKRLFSSFLALSLAATLASFPAYAEDESSEKPDGDIVNVSSPFSVVLDFSDAYSTGNLADVCYPGRPYAYDATVTLTVNGETYTGNQETSLDNFSSTRVYNFPELTAVPETATLSISTDASTFINLDDGDLYQYKLTTSPSKDKPDTTSITLTTSDWADLGDGEAYRALAFATADDYGLCSTLVVDRMYDIQTASYAFEHREEYTPNVLTDVTASVSGTETSHSQPVNGVVHFRVPTKWDSSIGEYTKKANVTLDMFGVDVDMLNTPFTAQLMLSVDNGGVSAYEGYYNLADCDFCYVGDDKNESGEEEPDDDNSVVEDDAEDVIDNGSYFSFTIDTALDTYNTSLIYDNLFANLMGKVTQDFIDTYGSGELGKQGAWAELNVYSDNTEKVCVAAGDYTIEGSDLLSLEYKGNLTVKEKATNKVNLKVAPKYTLELTSKAGTIDCTVDGAAFDGETKINFMLEGNQTYYIVDNDTGYSYEVKATDENPHLKLALGSTNGAIIPDDTNKDFEDVPNTSDNISIVGIVFGICVLLFAGSIFFVYRLNKKEERRKR